MKVHYYPGTDSLYIELHSGPGATTREIADGVNVDFDYNGAIVGFDIDNASRHLDTTALEADALPLFTRLAG